MTVNQLQFCARTYLVSPIDNKHSSIPDIVPEQEMKNAVGKWSQHQFYFGLQMFNFAHEMA